MSTVTGNPAEAPAEDTADEAGTAPGDRRFRPDVEGLRAVAVLLVVLYHANLPGLSGGFVGVDVFFVISGFVITGLLLRERTATSATSLVSFYGRRARRILPAATLTIIATVVATYIVLGIVYGNPTAVAARWTAVFLANFHFAAIGTDYLSAHQPPSPLQNFWSLAVEEQFYLVYPAIFLVAASLRSHITLRARLVAVLVPVIAMSLLMSAVQTGSDPNGAFFSPWTRAWELALGALVAVVTPTLLRLPRVAGATITWVGLAAVGVAAVAYSSSTPYPGTAVILPVVGTALVIAGGTAVPARGAESLLRLGLFQWFGRLSYSLYLWHWPILVLAAESASQNGLPFHRNVVWLVVSVAAAYATFRIIENPVRHARIWTGRRWLPVVLGLVLIATSLGVATAALASRGTPETTSGSGPRLTLLTPAQVSSAVADAPHITHLPPDLRPTLADVPSDWGGPVSSCWGGFGQTSVSTCSFGDPHGTRTVVVYGDSHAAMWFDSLSLVALVAHWRLVILAKGDCPAIDLEFRNPPGYGTPEGVFQACNTWHRFAVNRIRTLDPDLVIVTQDADLTPGGGLYSSATWQTAMVRTIRQLPVPASRVIVLGNIPQIPRGGPQCLSLYPNNVQKCSGSNSPYIAQHSDAERQAAALTGARFIDTVPWFCSTICTDVIGHFQPYWDAYHVTATYSIALSPALGVAIDLTSYPPAAG
jgi:peptidoglycan/LPS O-acetylase OafA/YrhL